MGGKSAQSRLVIEGLHTDHGVRYQIRGDHPIGADFGSESGESAIARLEDVGRNVDVTRFEDGRTAVHLKLFPEVRIRSAISLRDLDGVVVDTFRLHLPESLVPEGPHREAVESVGQLVETANPPTHLEVSVPAPGEPHAGVPHVVFDPEESRPRNLRFLPVSHLAAFMADLKRLPE
ncbi:MULTISPECIES: hypothetical protein [Halolamina]|uniref:hypothetical protein n=1 Tax=Halolamina TaxID=1075397 RepID=UPI0011601FCC|nr:MULTISPECIES: hypothetical protein [Halolamina]NHX37982.1 hypothetical protein [Halolamina sp. R1-12]